jgi:hypothetical protein
MAWATSDASTKTEEVAWATPERADETEGVAWAPSGRKHGDQGGGLGPPNAKTEGLEVAWAPPKKNPPRCATKRSRGRWEGPMTPITFESFDPSNYQRMGRLDILEALALGRALIELCPRDASPQIDRISDKLEHLVSEGETMLTTRRRESAPTDHTMEVLLDALADSLWSTLRNRLDGWSVFEHRGMASVLPAHGRRSVTATTLALARKKAERARALSGRLFGAEGLAFIRLPYPAQARSMASILRLIEEDGLTPVIDELAGPELMVALAACQTQYEAMVKARMSRTDRKTTHFGMLGGKLRRVLARYVSAVLTLLDEDEPESLALVLAALQPIEVLRNQSSRGTGRPEEDDVDSPEDDEVDDEANDQPAVA